jgi:hypothetical protein
MSDRVRALLVDDDQLLRSGLRAILSSDDSIEVVGEAENGRYAVERARALLTSCSWTSGCRTSTASPRPRCSSRLRRGRG